MNGCGVSKAIRKFLSISELSVDDIYRTMSLVNKNKITDLTFIRFIGQSKKQTKKKRTIRKMFEKPILMKQLRQDCHVLLFDF